MEHDGVEYHLKFDYNEKNEEVENLHWEVISHSDVDLEIDVQFFTDLAKSYVEDNAIEIIDEYV